LLVRAWHLHNTMLVLTKNNTVPLELAASQTIG
jgi:hypothetical protein